MDTYTGLTLYDSMDIEVDENGNLNLLGTLSGDIMLRNEENVRYDDTDPFEKITIHDGTFPDMGESLTFNAQGNAVIAGEVWIDSEPVTKYWVYDGDTTETVELGEGFAMDVRFGENGDMFIAGFTYDWEACYWTVDSQDTETQQILDTRESPDSGANSILVR